MDILLTLERRQEDASVRWWVFHTGTNEWINFDVELQDFKVQDYSNTFEAIIPVYSKESLVSRLRIFA